MENARFYGISTPLSTPVESTEGKTLVVQFSVKHEQKIDCGGGYIKLFPSSLDPKNLHGDAPYNIMFGKLSFSLYLTFKSDLFTAPWMKNSLLSFVV